jgi:hypothetical protein
MSISKEIDDKLFSFEADAWKRDFNRNVMPSVIVLSKQDLCNLRVELMQGFSNLVQESDNKPYTYRCVPIAVLTGNLSTAVQVL